MKPKVSLLKTDSSVRALLVGSLLVITPVWAQDTDSQGNAASENVQVQTSEPEVIVEQTEPEVSVVQPTPEVKVQQAEPEIVINDAQPEVKVNQADPKVNIIESEPEINIVEKGETAQPGQQAAGQEQQQAAQTDDQLQGKSALMQMEVTQVRGMSVENRLGEELGSVKDIVVDRQTGNAGLVILVGGFWGFGGTEVFVPVDDVAVAEDLIVWQTSLSEEVIKEQAQYDQQNYVSVID